MAKFKVGDRVRWASNFRRDDGSIRSVYEIDGSNVWYETTNTDVCPGKYRADEDDLELDEHPALTLAKAEVVRLVQIGIDRRTHAQEGALLAFCRVLNAFGLRYALKPVVPQPVKYEFVPVQDATQPHPDTRQESRT